MRALSVSKVASFAIAKKRRFNESSTFEFNYSRGNISELLGVIINKDRDRLSG
jgi:hypothetical protein